MSESRQQLRDKRLLGEYKELMEFSARSLLVKIEPVGPHFPPTEYLVTYNCLGYTDSSMTKTTTGHKMRITLPERYPEVPPIFQYESKVWAPAFFESYTASEHGGRTIRRYICIGHIGTPRLPLLAFVIGVGHMIQLRRDARGYKPIDTRSLEGPNVEELITVAEPVADFEIVVLDSTPSQPKDAGKDNLGDLIKILGD